MQEKPLVYLNTDPFPHAVIDNFYNNEELDLLWKEIEYLSSPNRMIKSGEELGTAKEKLSATTLSDGYGIFLNSIFKESTYSDILTITDKIFNQALLNSIAALDPLLRDVSDLNTSGTKLRYYEDTEEYKSHVDTSRYTMISYFYKEPKAFTGGDLHFKDFDYTIEIKPNRVIFFKSCLYHASTKVVTNKFSKPFSGNGKYSITKFLDVKDAD